ncbi:hypothetical protein ACLOJK_003614 [Asimina triloba]
MYAARLEQEHLKEDMVELLTDLAVVKAKQDEAVNDAETIILAKQDLEKALANANVELVSLRGRPFEANSSLCRLIKQGEWAREKASRLLAEFAAARSEAKALRA